MGNYRQLSDAVLKANGLAPDAADEKELETLKKQIASTSRWARLFRRIAFAAFGGWLVVLPVGLYVLSRTDLEGQADEILAGALCVLLYIGLAASVFYWVRARRLSQYELKKRLARIEMQLKKLSDGSGQE